MESIEKEKCADVYFSKIEKLYENLANTLVERTKDCIDPMCKFKNQKTYHILNNCPKVFTFNLAWGDDPISNQLQLEDLLNFYMLLPNIFDPFTIFKKKKHQK